ncbi:hypothetical protein [Pseudomonas sp. 25 E 4]|uniref:hypothetical protein n=1 Tax=Pseudomonas sp. 25 E 4 TaxID=1844097 RepID=UPI000812118A|nr:hypothetical protein [Pseudomonas sp. 25 E 4]CRM71128.1 hypothetical protein [Pseudomonas sp. 25 E 4]
MKTKIIDQVWHKIADLDSQGHAAAVTKLEQVVEVGRRISQAEGGEVANNVMEHGLIEVALLRCRQIQDRELGLGYDDLQIYYLYATNAMKNAEKVIDAELAHLDI